jgi:hypothetical protein
MKKILMGLGVLIILIISLTAATCDYEESSTSKNNRTNENIAQKAITSTPVPQVEYFLERQTVAKWFQAWDQPDQISYVYVWMYGNPVGYYVVNGKPVSTRSYLTPEEQYYMNGAVLQTPSLDGTYGLDNIGWHFFDASGVAVAVEGPGASILFTNAKLPLSNFPDLTGKK